MARMNERKKERMKRGKELKDTIIRNVIIKGIEKRRK
jgi:hypothetical protein